jgi:hypothetical protein
MPAPWPRPTVVSRLERQTATLKIEQVPATRPLAMTNRLPKISTNSILPPYFLVWVRGFGLFSA